ncbi:MAG: hypothetical protein R2724_21800 [Bryobacterales bacterium]
MKRHLLFAISDRPSLLERLRTAFEPETRVLALAPHADSVLAAASILQPSVLVVDLMTGCAGSSVTTTRLLEEMGAACSRATWVAKAT